MLVNTCARWAALLIGLLLASGGASAQSLQLSTMKCKEFIDLPKETILTVTIWLDGYYTDEEDAALVEYDKLKMKAERLANFCAQNPKMGLMMAAENSMAK